MANFKTTIITQKGHALIAKLEAGTATSNFKKICTSDYDYSSLSNSQLEELTSIRDTKQTILPDKISVINKATVKVSGTLTNTELKTGYYIRTIALYAVDPDEGEILYSITPSTLSDFIPPNNGVTSSGVIIDLLTTVSNAENVSIDVDPNAIVSIQTFNDFKDEVNSQLNENTQSIATANSNISNLNSAKASLVDLNSEVENRKSAVNNVQGQVNSLVLGAVGDGNNAEIVQAKTDNEGFYNYVINDRIESVENALKTGIKKCSFLFEQGGINSNTGENIDTSINLRTSKIYDLGQDTTLHLSDGYKLFAYRYSKTDNSFVNSSGWLTGDIAIKNLFNYKFVIAKSTNESIMAVEGINLYFEKNYINNEINQARTFDGENFDSISESIENRVVFNFNKLQKLRENNYVYDICEFNLFEKGSLNLSDGSNTTDDNNKKLRLRTKGFIDSNVHEVIVEDGYSFLVLAYDNTGKFFSGTATWYKRCLLNARNTDYKYKIVVKKDNESEIKVKDSTYVHLYYKNSECRQWWNTTVNFMGDSITQGVNTNKVYCWYLNDYIDFKVVNNYGANGTCISTYNAPAPSACMCERIKEMSKSSDLNIVFGGTNDFNRGVPIGDVIKDGVYNTDKNTFIGALISMILYHKTNYPQIPLLLLTPIHRSTFDTQPTDLETNVSGLKLRNYVDAVIEVGKELSVPVINLYNDLGINPNITEDANKYWHDGSDGNTVDKLHPNYLGHEKIAQSIFNTLKYIFPKDYVIVSR